MSLYPALSVSRLRSLEWLLDDFAIHQEGWVPVFCICVATGRHGRACPPAFLCKKLCIWSKGLHWLERFIVENGRLVLPWLLMQPFLYPRDQPLTSAWLSWLDGKRYLLRQLRGLKLIDFFTILIFLFRLLHVSELHNCLNWSLGSQNSCIRF